jgi:hypothetical protein
LEDHDHAIAQDRPDLCTWSSGGVGIEDAHEKAASGDIDAGRRCRPEATERRGCDCGGRQRARQVDADAVYDGVGFEPPHELLEAFCIVTVDRADDDDPHAIGAPFDSDRPMDDAALAHGVLLVGFVEVSVHAVLALAWTNDLRALQDDRQAFARTPQEVALTS